MSTIPTIDSITLAHVTGGAGQGPGSAIQQAGGLAWQAGQKLGQYAAGLVRPQPSAPANGGGLSPIRPGMSGLAIRERLDNKGI